MNTKKTKSFSESVYIFIPILIISILGLCYITQNKTIKVSGDEFGYWMGASWILGKDWSDVASINSYYGYGYGMLLSLILMLPIDPVHKYQLSIVLNIMMLIAVYLIIYHLLNKLCSADKKYLSLLALTVTLYTGNLYHLQFTMFETLFLLGFWLFIFFLYSLNNKYSLYKVLLGIVLLTYLYSSHHRAISVVFAGLICILLVQIKQKKYRDIFITLAIAGLFLFGSEWIKHIYQESYLTNEHLSNLYYNDYSGQTQKVKAVATTNGLFTFVTAFIGKIFYLLSSTYLLGGIALYQITKDICTCLKEKKVTSDCILEIFLFLSAFVSMAITSMYFSEYKSRFEVLIYGRYHEFFMSSLILMGLIILLKSKSIDIKQLLCVGGIYIFSLLVTNKLIPRNAPEDFSRLFSAGIADSLDMWENNLFAVGLKTIVIFLAVFALTKVIKNQPRTAIAVCVCAILSITWVGSYLYTYTGSLLTTSTLYAQRNLSFANAIKQMGCENDLYFYARDGHQINFLQILLEDTEIKCIFTAQQIEELPPNAYLITQENSKLHETDVLNDYQMVLYTTPLQLWKISE